MAENTIPTSGCTLDARTFANFFAGYFWSQGGSDVASREQARSENYCGRSVEGVEWS